MPSSSGKKCQQGQHLQSSAVTSTTVDLASNLPNISSQQKQSMSQSNEIAPNPKSVSKNYPIPVKGSAQVFWMELQHNICICIT